MEGEPEVRGNWGQKHPLFSTEVRDATVGLSSVEGCFHGEAWVC